MTNDEIKPARVAGSGGPGSAGILAGETMPPHKGWHSRGYLRFFMASEANKILGRAGTVWLREYHDRFIRDENHFAKAVEYIEQNPVKARLVKEAKDWKFGSAARNAGIPAGEVTPT